MLTWISEQAKWVIYIFIVFILAGLLFMDMSQLQTDRSVPVGTVDGKPIINEEFQSRLQQAQSAQAGANMTDVQAAQLRHDLFEQFVQERVLAKQISANELVASVAEMHRDLRDDPPAGIKDAPIFMTDSVFDQSKYEAWLATDSIYDDPQLLQYESYLKTQKVPLKQLQLLVAAGHHPSTLESRWVAANREQRTDLWVAYAPVDSFPVAKPDSASIRAYFDANPDSFYVQKDFARIEYVALPIRPSTQDDKSAQEYTQILLNQIKDGADFAEVATASSEDLQSAPQGGLLENPAQWGTVVRDTLLALDSGVVVGPIKSEHGWHLLKATGAKGSGAGRQILVKITASTETVDSLEAILRNAKTEIDGGKAFAEVAKAANINLQTSEWIGKGDEYPAFGYVTGLQSYMFRNPELPKSDEIASSILQNKEWVVLAVKTKELKAGERSLDLFTGAIANALTNQKSVELAKEYLKSQLPALQALSTVDSTQRNAIPKIILESLQGVSAEGFVPGVGYASPSLYKVIKTQKVGEWGPIVDGMRSAATVKLVNKTEPESTTLAAMAQSETASAWMYGSYSLFGEWMKNIRDRAKVVNNLDLYFSE